MENIKTATTNSSKRHINTTTKRIMYALQPKMKNRSSRSRTWRAARTDGGSLGGFCSVHVRLLLSLHDVLLVADPLVPEPVAHLEVGA